MASASGSIMPSRRRRAQALAAAKSVRALALILVLLSFAMSVCTNSSCQDLANRIHPQCITNQTMSQPKPKACNIMIARGYPHAN